MSLYIKFLGAIGQVTGSCTWLYHEPSDTQFLVDCGMNQGEADGDQKNKAAFPFDPSQIKFILLTHAHIDHCGLIPKLYKEGFRGKVHCLSVTAELTKLSLDDTSKLSGGLYNKDDVESIKFKCIDVGAGRPCRSFRLADDLTARALRTSHILGSVSYELTWVDETGKRRTICFSGDLGNNTDKNPYQSLLKGRQSPSPYVEYIVSESTYGERERDEKYQSYDQRMNALREVISSAYSEHEAPKIIIPAFALNRSQEILLDLATLFETKLGDAPEHFFYEADASKKIISGKISYNYLIRGLCCKGLSAEKVRSYIEQFEPSLTNSCIKRLKKLDRKNFDRLHDESEILSKALELGYQKELNYTLNSQTSDQGREEVVEVMSRRFRAPQVIMHSKLAIAYSIVFAKWMAAVKPGDSGKYEFTNKELASRIGCEQGNLSGYLRALFELDSQSLHSLSDSNQGMDIVKGEGTQQLLRRSPKIWISASGMCSAGPVTKLISESIEESHAIILLTGYQSPGTLGFDLKKVGEFQNGCGAEDFQIDFEGALVKASSIKAKVIDLSPYYSGHADVNGILDFIIYKDELKFEGTLPTATIFLNHGDDKARSALKERIVALEGSASNIRPIENVYLPDERSGWFNLTQGRWSEPPLKFSAIDTSTTEAKSNGDKLSRIIELLEQQNTLLVDIRQKLECPQR